jgi:hypothetical protein
MCLKFYVTANELDRQIGSQNDIFICTARLNSVMLRAPRVGSVVIARGYRPKSWEFCRRYSCSPLLARPRPVTKTRGYFVAAV